MGVGAADLVLQGYALQQVAVDDAPFTGSDGQLIHAGDHLHDPCFEVPGQRFALSAGGGGGEEEEARGFVVVNDCQVVVCTKWNTAFRDRTGGKTVIYDLVAQDGNTEAWKVTNSSLCSCNEDNVNGEAVDEVDDSDCYTGKFLLVDDYKGASCDIAYSPGSIDCVTGESFVPVVTPTKSWQDDILEMGGKVGLAIAVAVVMLLLCCCFYCCCCRRRRKNNKDDASEITDKSDEEAPEPRQVSKRAVAQESAVPSGSKRGGWGMFARNNNKDKKEETRASEESLRKSSKQSSRREVKNDEVEQEESPKKKWWFFAKPKSEKKPAVQAQERETVPKSKSVNRGLEEQEASDIGKKKSWFFASSGKNKSQSSVNQELPESGADDCSNQGTTSSWFSWRGNQSVATDQRTAVASNTESTRRWGKNADDDTTLSGKSAANQKAAASKETSSSKTKDDKQSKKKKADEALHENVEDETVEVDCTCCGGV